MKPLYILTALVALSSPSLADHPMPPVPEGGINYFMQSPCVDNETKETGFCFMGTTRDGRTILTFWQNDELMFIREVKGESYETIWMAHGFGTV